MEIVIFIGLVQVWNIKKQLSLRPPDLYALAVLKDANASDDQLLWYMIISDDHVI